MVGERRRPVPADRRRLGRPRARVRALVRLAIPMVLSAVVVILAVTAVAQIGPASGPYRRTVDRGYAALAGAARGAVERLGRGPGRLPVATGRRSAGSPSSPISTPSPPTPPRSERRYDALTPPDPVCRCRGARRPWSTGPRPSRRCGRVSRASSGGATGLGGRRRGRRRVGRCARPRPPWRRPTRRGRRVAAPCGEAPGSARSCRPRRGCTTPAVLATGALALVVAAIAASHSLAPVHSLADPRRRHRPPGGGERDHARGARHHAASSPTSCWPNRGNVDEQGSSSAARPPCKGPRRAPCSCSAPSTSPPGGRRRRCSRAQGAARLLLHRAGGGGVTAGHRDRRAGVALDPGPGATGGHLDVGDVARRSSPSGDAPSPSSPTSRRRCRASGPHRHGGLPGRRHHHPRVRGPARPRRPGQLRR